MSIYKGTTLIAGSLPNSANQDLSNLSQTGQAVIDGKADTDLSNATDNGKILMSSMGMPSDKYIDLTLGANGASYTAPANGWFCVRKVAASTNQYVAMGSNRSKICSKCFSPVSSGEVCVSIPVLKNQTVWISYSASGSTNLFCFIYAQGSESEAS